MPIDHSIYFQQKTPDIMGNIESGLEMRDMIDKRKLKKEEIEKQKAMDEAYQQGLVQNPDGTMTLDRNRTLGAMAGIKGAGRETFEAKSKFDSEAISQENARMENALRKVQTTGRLLGGVKDQASWENFLREAPKHGIDISKEPRAFDQSYVEANRVKGMTLEQQIADQWKQREHQISQQRLGIDKERLNLDRQKTAAEVQKLRTSGGISEGIKAADKGYAKDYNEFIGGGAVQAKNAIQKLKDYKAQLEKDNGFFQAGGGPISGSLNDGFRTEASISQRDNIITAANSGLKATFGGQLSDGERKSAANEFYNDKLGNSENVKILDRKIRELEENYAAQTAKAQYFRQNRTLDGFGEQVADQRAPRSEQPTKAPVFKGNQIDWAE